MALGDPMAMVANLGAADVGLPPTFRPAAWATALTASSSRTILPGRPTGGRALAVLLVAAMLLCHGATGPAPVLPGPDAPAEHHRPARGAGDPPVHHGEVGADCYVTVLLAAALGFLGGAAPAARSRTLDVTKIHPHGESPPRATCPHPPAPTSPLLAVFRL